MLSSKKQVQPRNFRRLKAKARKALKKQVAEVRQNHQLRKYLRNQFSKNLIKKKGLAGYYGRKRKLT